MLNAIFEVNELQRTIEIGCAPDEHGVTQGIRVTLRATLAGSTLFAGDTLTPPYDYMALIQAVDDAIASRPRFILQETLFVAIAARALADPQVLAIDIALAKTERYDGCRWIGIQATLDRSHLPALAARYPEDAALAPWRAGAAQAVALA